MGNEERKQDDGNPKFLQRNVANLNLVGWEVVSKRSRPDLGTKVAGHADEGTRKDQSLCTASANVGQKDV